MRKKEEDKERKKITRGEGRKGERRGKNFLKKPKKSLRDWNQGL